jgi:hypothetical protein
MDVIQLQRRRTGMESRTHDQLTCQSANSLPQHHCVMLSLCNQNRRFFNLCCDPAKNRDADAMIYQKLIVSSEFMRASSLTDTGRGAA